MSATESDNKSGGAGTAGGGGGGSQSVVEVFSSDVQNQRRRFEVDLKPDETTVVSWVELLKDSGIQVDQPRPSSPERSMEYRVVTRRITRSQGNLKTEVTKLESSPRNAK